MIYAFLANGFEEVEALAPVDLLRRAGKQVTLVGVGGDTVQGSHGITVVCDMPDGMFRDPHPECVILPGGMPGTRNLAASRTVKEALRVTAATGGLLAAICAAPTVLAAEGYLAGKSAVCYPGMEQALTEGGATALDPRRRLCVRDGNVITAAGPGAAMAFGFSLVETFCGKQAADDLRHATVSD